MAVSSGDGSSEEKNSKQEISLHYFLCPWNKLCFQNEKDCLISPLQNTREISPDYFPEVQGTFLKFSNISGLIA